MTERKNILQELSELKSTLATINPPNPYTVPAGYFEGMASQVLKRIKALEAANAVEELGYLSPELSKLAKQIPYVIPSGYFEGLAEKILLLLNTQPTNLASNEELETLSPLLSNLNKEMPFAVPPGYFEGLALTAIHAVNTTKDAQTAKEELATLSPLLSGLKKDMPFTVPQGYFESLADNGNKEENKPAVKIISITHRKWFRYAAAAVVVGIIAMAGFIINNKSVDPSSNSYGWVKKNFHKVSTDKLNEFIQLVDEDRPVENSVAVTNKTKEIKELIKDVPEKEIERLLDDTEILDEPANNDEALLN